MLCENYGLSRFVSYSYSGRAVLSTALLVFAACGSRPSSSQVAEMPRAPETATTASAVLPATSMPGAESTVCSAPAAEEQIAPKSATLPGIVRKAFPTAGSAHPEPSPFPHRVIRDGANHVLGYEVFSDSAGVTAMGYAGLVPVQVFFDSRGKPVRIYILDNNETPAYMDIVAGAGLLERLLAFDPACPDSLDAVTFATSSSRAIIAGVTGLAAKVSAELVVKPSRRPR